MDYDNDRVTLAASELGCVVVYTPVHTDGAELVEYLRSEGVDIEARRVDWAGPYETLMAVSTGIGAAVTVGGLILNWLQSKPNYTLTVDLGNGRTITRSGRNLPTDAELAEIDRLFARYTARPNEVGRDRGASSREL